MRREGRAGICGTNICNANNINHSQLLTSVCFSVCGVFYMSVTQMLCRRMSPRDESQDDSLDRVEQERGKNSGTE